jgi:hypothetical protein
LPAVADVPRTRIYDEAVLQTLALLWERPTGSVENG